MPKPKSAKPPMTPEFREFHRKLQAATTHDEILEAQHGKERTVDGMPDFPDMPRFTIDELVMALSGGFAI